MNIKSTDSVNSSRMSWWRDAKFGMFIHWGLYAIPAGEWKGKEIPGIGEWIMKVAQIPVKEYEQLAAQFNPIRFDAAEWVKIAKDAGMKYIVITAKHHDGFCMYHSKVSKFNIVDATPFGRDPMKELAEECAKAGLKLCFYYSQTQDWHEKDAVGNDWDFQDSSEKNFERYLEQKVKPQVKELLTQYGPVGLIWFDTPMTMTDKQSRELADFVTDIQPDCLVNGRVGNGFGDYICLGDNETPAKALHVDWETCATLNHTWGFKKNDHHWKSPELITKLLADIVGKGGTYLLNVGPTAEGIIPEPSVNVLKEVGRWIETNGEAIRGTSGTPFETEFEWGTITLKQGRVYIHLFQWPNDKFSLNGLKNKVLKAYLLQDSKTELTFDQSFDSAAGFHTLNVKLPEKAPDSNVSVLVLEIDGDASADNTLMQRANRYIVLEAHQAQFHKQDINPALSLSRSGVTVNWSNANEWLNWEFKAVTPGSFQVEIISLAEKARERIGEHIGRWEGGHRVMIEAAGQQLNCVMKEDERIVNSRSLYFNRIVSQCGTIRIDEPGTYPLKLKPVALNFGMELGLKLVSVNLVPAD
jgi:alpha-L-fucosidase